jgi:hypothetical protein
VREGVSKGGAAGQEEDHFPISGLNQRRVPRREFTKSLALSCAAFCPNGALAAIEIFEEQENPQNVRTMKIGDIH